MAEGVDSEVEQVGTGEDSSSIKTDGSELLFTKMNKDNLNALIVNLRPCVTQAKVHIIHKLTKQIDVLDKRKCVNEEQKKQNERKSGRFKEEIDILKRCSKDLIGKWVLHNKISFDDVTKKETLTQKFDLKTRVFARVSEHKTVKAAVWSARDKFPNWEAEVPLLLKTLGRKRKKKEDPNKLKLGIRQKKSKPCENNQSNDSKETATDNSDPDFSENDVQDATDPGISESEDQDAQDNTDDEANESGDEEIFVSSLKNSIKSRREPKLDPSISFQRNTSDGVVKLFDLLKEDQSSLTVPHISNTEKYSLTKKRSSFFIGGTDESEDSSDDQASEGGKDDDISAAHVSQTKIKKQGQLVGEPKRKSKAFSKTKSKKVKVLTQPNTRKPTENISVTSEEPSSNHEMHPSWVAKQKKKPAIRDFKGKKTVFDDFSSAPATAKVEKSIQHNSIEQSELHPSWAAKQKHKPAIANFQGKKIVFGD